MTDKDERWLTVRTPVGEARALVTGDGPGLAAFGHGAGGGVGSADLVAVTAALVQAGWTVARVEQPYRVQGRRAPDRAPKLDVAWAAVMTTLTEGRSGPLVVGGRSSGARVACRTAGETGASAVICLAFPLHPPGRPSRSTRQQTGTSRAGELSCVGTLPLLVVQGERDAFGGPSEFPAGVEVVGVPGDHSLRKTAPVIDAVVSWLGRQELT